MQKIFSSFLSNHYVQLALTGILCGLAGLWIGVNNKPEPEVITQVEYEEVKVVDQEAITLAVAKAEQEWKKLQKTRVVTKVITKPSGEKIEETISETETLETKEETNEKSNEELVVVKEETKKKEDTSVEIKPYVPQWSVGLSVKKQKEDILSTLPQDELDYELRVGRNVGLNIWAESSYQFKSQEFGIGLRFQF